MSATGGGDEMETGISLLVSVDEQSLRSARQEIEDVLGESVSVDVDVNVGDPGGVDIPTPELPAVDRPELGQPDRPDPPALDAPNVPEPPALAQPEVVDPPALEQPDVPEPPALEQPEIVDPPALEQPDAPEPPELPVPVAVTDGSLGLDPQGQRGQTGQRRGQDTPALAPPDIAAALPEPRVVPDGGGVATDGGRQQRQRRAQTRSAKQTAEQMDELVRLADDIEENTAEGGGGGGGSILPPVIGGGIVGRVLSGGLSDGLAGLLSGGAAGLLSRLTSLAGPGGAILGGGALTLNIADRLDDLSIPLSDQAADILRAPFAGALPMLETNFELIAGAVEQLTGFELSAPDVEVPPIPDLGLPPVPDLGLPGSIPSLGLPGSIPSLGLPGSIPNLGLPGSIPNLGPPGNIPDLGLPSNITDILRLKVPPLPSFIPVAPTEGLINTIQSFVSNIDDGGGLTNPISEAVDTFVSGTPTGLALQTGSDIASGLFGGGGGGGGDGSEPAPPDGQADPRTGPGLALPDEPPAQPETGQLRRPVRVTSEFDTTVNLGDISVEITADFADLKRELLDDVSDALNQQQQDLRDEVDRVEDSIDDDIRDLRRDIDSAIRATR
jgi:hypothetical protein